jgi:hypothetical protein
MSNGILHILEVTVIRDFILKIKFNDGTVKVVDVKPLLTGPVFEPLNDLAFLLELQSIR